MNTLFKRYIFFPMILLFFATACTKDRSSTQEDSYLEDIAVMLNQEANSLGIQEVITDDPSQNIYMINDGIPSDFLVDESYLETSQQGTNTEDSINRVYIRDHSFIRCLRGLSLSENQVTLIKKDLREYNACNENAVKRAKKIYQNLKEKYRIQYKRLWNAYQNNTITLREFRLKVAELKENFKLELRNLHLKAKINEALKKCLRVFLIDLHGNLTERQWKAFVDCYR